MKISNETKVGALTAVAITILILGYNFLKGKSLFDNKRTIYAVFENTAGLPEAAAPVTYNNSLQIGVTGKKVKNDKFASKVIVPIILNDNEIQIPKNSIAVINGSALGLSTANLDIIRGSDNSSYLKDGDTINTKASSDILGEVTKQLNPVLYEVKNAVHSLDSILMVIGSTFDPSAKSNFQSILANVNRTTANLIGTSAQLETVLATQNGNIDKALNNVNTFTSNLNKNNEKITSTMSNIDKATGNFAKLDIDATLVKLNKSIDEIKGLVTKIGNNDGTLGLLMKDADLYNQLHNLTFSMNTLVDDLKVNPKRYISLLGRKDKKIKPLDKPLYDSVPNK